jgi:hypothetical protein
MTILSLRLTRFPAIFCAIMLCLGTASVYANPLILEGRLGAASGAAFHPAFDLRTTAFSISGPGTERDPSHIVQIRGFDDTSGGPIEVGQLRTLIPRGWQRATRATPPSMAHYSSVQALL